jgi:hypothetical protein
VPRANSTRVTEPRTGSVRTFSFSDTGHRALLRLAYRFESEKLQNKADPFYYILKTDTSKAVAFLGLGLKR